VPCLLDADQNRTDGSEEKNMSKLADLKDNSDPLRIGRPLSEPEQGIMKRYWDAIALMDRLP
jgi:hypothetical protein